MSSSERPTGRIRWMRVSHDGASHDPKRPAAVKLQMEVKIESWQHGVPRHEGTFISIEWRDIPLVNEYGGEIDDKLHMPMWKLD